MPKKEEDDSLNKIDLLLKSYSRIQITFQSLIKIGEDIVFYKMFDRNVF